MSALYTSLDWERIADEESHRGDRYRSPARKDYARLLHSASWRRMQGKTQLFPGLDSEFFRNRLTHSLEVAQIAKSVALRLNIDKLVRAPGRQAWKIDLDLVEFAGLAHDLGHPPFGHEGEHALDNLMKPYGGFEGNAQTLRILSALEEKVRGGHPVASLGLNLTFRSLAAVLKYDQLIPKTRNAKAALCKGYYSEEAELVEFVKNAVSQSRRRPSKFKTLECTIMDVADDIAYSTYDLEDSMKAGFRTPLDLLGASDDVMERVLKSTNKNLQEEGFARTEFQEVTDVLTELVEYSGLYDELPVVAHGPQTPADQAKISKSLLQAARATSEVNWLRTRFTSKLIGLFVDSVKVSVNPKNPPLSKAYLERPIRLRVELLKHLNFETMIRSHKLRIVAHRGREIVHTIFSAIVKNPDLLPDHHLATFAKLPKKQERMRCICDFVACMTDKEAVDFYARLRSERHTTIFKPIG
jgi:dGTPase